MVALGFAKEPFENPVVCARVCGNFEHYPPSWVGALSLPEVAVSGSTALASASRRGFMTDRRGDAKRRPDGSGITGANGPSASEFKSRVGLGGSRGTSDRERRACDLFALPRQSRCPAGAKRRTADFADSADQDSQNASEGDASPFGNAPPCLACLPFFVSLEPLTAIAQDFRVSAAGASYVVNVDSPAIRTSRLDNYHSLAALHGYCDAERTLPRIDELPITGPVTPAVI